MRTIGRTVLPQSLFSAIARCSWRKYRPYFRARRRWVSAGSSACPKYRRTGAMRALCISSANNTHEVPRDRTLAISFQRCSGTEICSSTSESMIVSNSLFSKGTPFMLRFRQPGAVSPGAGCQGDTASCGEFTKRSDGRQRRLIEYIKANFQPAAIDTTTGEPLPELVDTAMIREASPRLLLQKPFSGFRFDHSEAASAR